jgi:hypothetical protein
VYDAGSVVMSCRCLQLSSLCRSLGRLGHITGAETAVEQLTHSVSQVCMQRLVSFSGDECASLVEHLLQFWKASLASTELLPRKDTHAGFPTSVSTLGTVAAAVCSLGEGTLHSDRRSPEQQHMVALSAGAWREVFHVFALVCGPISAVDSSLPRPTMDDGTSII